MEVERLPVKLHSSWPSRFYEGVISHNGKTLGFFQLISSYFFFIQEPSIWLGSRVTTSPFGLLTARGFECCCTNVDASCINEGSAL